MPKSNVLKHLNSYWILVTDRQLAHFGIQHFTYVKKSTISHVQTNSICTYVFHGVLGVNLKDTLVAPHIFNMCLLHTVVFSNLKSHCIARLQKSCYMIWKHSSKINVPQYSNAPKFIIAKVFILITVSFGY